MLNQIVAWGIVLTFISYIVFSIYYAPERPSSQGHDDES